MACQTSFTNNTIVAALLLGFFGVVVFAVSLHLILEAETWLPDTAGLYWWTLYAPLAFGILAFVVATVGCGVDDTTNRRTQILSLIFTLSLAVFGAIVLAAGSSLIVLVSSYMPTIATSSFATQGEFTFVLAGILTGSDYLTRGTDIPPGHLGLQRQVSDFMLGLYVGCCKIGDLPKCPRAVVSGNRNYCFSDVGTYRNGVFSGNHSSAAYCALHGIKSTCPEESSGLNIHGFLLGNTILLQQYFLPAAITFTVIGVLSIVFGFAEMFSSFCEQSPEYVEKENSAHEDTENKPNAAPESIAKA